MSIATDRQVLRGAAYDADDDLRVRRETHARYSERQLDFHEWVLSLLPRQPAEALLDVGTGPGDFLLRLHEAGHRGVLVGCDLSEGMMQGARASEPELCWLVADVQALPFRRGAFDGVMARHMLYHVPDIKRGVAELARVTREGGWLAAATNTRDSLQPLATLWRAVDHPAVVESRTISERFPLEEGGAYFEPYFERVITHRLDNAFCFPSPEPLKAYLASLRHLRLAPGHSEETWQEIRGRLFALADRFWEEHARDGILRISKAAGLIVAAGRRGTVEGAIDGNEKG